MLEDLRAHHPWPAEKPAVAPNDQPCWFGPGHLDVFKRFIGPRTKVVLELGSWLGVSTRAIADLMPQGTVIAVDTWKGSPEHFVDPASQKVLPVLWETFCVNCWDKYRDRILPIRSRTLDGMLDIFNHDIEPEAVYVDADHSTDAVYADILTVHRSWPRARILGDDWAWDSVRAGVEQLCRQNGWGVNMQGNVWWIEK